MKPQIVFDSWYEVETSCGTEVVPADLVGDNAEGDDFQDYLEGDYLSHESRNGYGARLSMPGYLDCTPWCVFDTYKEAREYLVDTWDIEPDDIPEAPKISEQLEDLA